MIRTKRFLVLTLTCVCTTLLAGVWAAGSAPQPTICERDCWVARAPQCSISQEPGLTRAVIHHTAGAADYNVSNLEESKARVRAIQNYHMDSNGWCDIGYHFLTDKLGNNFEGRAGAMTSLPRGAHDGVNTQSFGFNLMGYYHTPYNQVPTAEGRSSLYDVIAWRMPDGYSPYGAGSYGSLQNKGWLCGHRDVSATACPGDLLYAYIGTDVNAGEARDQVYARINGGATPTPTVTPTPTPAPPAAPTNLTATAISRNRIDLAWVDNANNEDNFVVERKKGKAAFAPIITLPANTTSYSDTTVSKNSTYTYRVKATNGGGSSAYSNEASATTPR